MNRLIYIPEKNPFFKDILSEEMGKIKENQERAKPFLVKIADTQERMLKKLIRHLFSLIPKTKRYKKHRAFLNKRFKSRQDGKTKRLLELFIRSYVDPFNGTASDYNEFWNDSQGTYIDIPIFHFHFNPKGKKSGKEIFKMLKEINKFFKGIAEFRFHYATVNASSVEVHFFLCLQ